MIKSNRRSFITGLGSLFIAAPAIVRVSRLMPVKVLKDTFALDDYSRLILAPMLNCRATDIAYGVLFIRPKWALELAA